MGFVDKTRFDGKIYLGLPADFTDLIIQKRVELTKKIPDFCNKNINLVDIGCGNGASIFMLADSFKTCNGIDIFPKNKEVFNKVKQEHHYNNCNIKLVDVENEKIAQQFDRLICFEVIEHFRYEKSVASLYEATNPGGLVAITVPNKWWIFETHGARLPLLPWNRVPFFSWLPTFIHERYANARIYTKRRIKKLLEHHGFKVKKMQYITAPMDVLPDGWLRKFLRKTIFRGLTTSIPFLSTAIFIEAVKPNK